MTRRAGRLLPGTTASRSILLVCVVLALAERFGEAWHLAPVWAASHLDDLVCLPLVLALALAVHRAAGRPSSWTLPWTHGLAVTALYAVTFEVVLPHWRGAGTADPVDAASYGFGFLVFHLLVNRPAAADAATVRGGATRPVAGPAAIAGARAGLTSGDS